MTVTVYTAPHCPACTMTKRHLDRRAIPYTEVSIDSDPGILAAAQELGLRQAPIVCAEGGLNGDQWAHAWDGYRPDRIDALITEAA